VPKSRVRRRPVYTPPPKQSGRRRHSPPWVAAAMVVCFLIGIAWLAVYYVTADRLAVFDALGGYNLLVGFLFIVAGFGLATRWR
jgi:hypothetical protein